MVSRVRERGDGIAGAGAGAGAQLFSFSLQSELLWAQEIPSELDADRNLFRVELILLNKQQKDQGATDICFLYKPGTDRYTVSTGLALLE